jgi:hypothetical protein
MVSLLYQLSRRLLSVPAVLLRRDISKDAELLVPGIRMQSCAANRWPDPLRTDRSLLVRRAVITAARDTASTIRFRCNQQRYWPSIAGSSPRSGTTACAVAQSDAQPFTPRSRGSSSTWRTRTFAGDIGGSRAS